MHIQAETSGAIVFAKSANVSSKRHIQNDDEWWDPYSQQFWFPDEQPVSVPEVDWYDRTVVVGRLYLPDGQVIEYTDEPPAFGFARYLEEIDYANE